MGSSVLTCTAGRATGRGAPSLPRARVRFPCLRAPVRFPCHGTGTGHCLSRDNGREDRLVYTIGTSWAGALVRVGIGRGRGGERGTGTASCVRVSEREGWRAVGGGGRGEGVGRGRGRRGGAGGSRCGGRGRRGGAFRGSLGAYHDLGISDKVRGIAALAREGGGDGGGDGGISGVYDGRR